MRTILKNSLFILVVSLIQVNNHPPVVQIIQPVSAKTYSWNSILPYSVKITDVEDGASQYEEISSSEVLVMLKFTNSPSRAGMYINQKKFPDTAGLMDMVISNCFNCHAVKSKLAGPSFQEISIKYKSGNQNRDPLVNHIISGSTGIWGKEVMPTHPELSKKQAAEMLGWIFKFAEDPSLHVYTGFQGSLAVTRPPGYKGVGTAIVSAYYRDHGTPNLKSSRITGSDHLMFQLSGQ